MIPIEPEEISPRPAAAWRLGVPFLLFALVTLAAFRDPLLLRRNFGGRDILGYNLPVEKAIHDAYARGRLPVWIENISGGRPLLPNPNAGSLYPVRPLLARVPFPLAMRIYPALHWVLAGLGMLVLSRCLGMSAAAAWVAAVTYAFSGVSISEVFYSNYQPGFALLPWLIWTLARPSRPGVRIVSVSLVFGLLFLAGDVFVCALGLLSAIFWIVRAVPRAEQVRALAALGASLGLAMLLALPQIVAAGAWIPVTNRGILGMRLREVLLYSVSPLRLLEFVIPYPFGPTWELSVTPSLAWKVFRYKSVGFFTSFYAGSLAVIGVAVTWKTGAPAARFARTLLGFALAISVLPSLVPTRFDLIHAPLPLRYPEKFVVGVILAVAILAGFAFDRLRARGRPPRWILGTGVGIGLIALSARLFPAVAGAVVLRLVGAEDLAVATVGTDLAGALAEAGLLWMATTIALEGAGAGRLRLALCLLLLTMVPLAGTRRIALTFREEEVFAPTPFDRFLARSDPGGRFRTLGESSYGSSKLEWGIQNADPGGLDSAKRNWEQYTHLLWDRGTVLNIDFDHGDLSRLESLRGMSFVASTYLDSAPFFGTLALRWGIRYRDQKPLGGYRKVRSLGWQDWDEHRRAFPDIRLLEKWRQVPTVLEAANTLPRLAEGEIVVEEGDAARSGAARPGTVRVLEKTPERFRLDIDAPDPSWLFVLRGFWAHRRVTVDGKPVEAVPAQVAFSALPVSAGRHRIDWEERLPGEEFSWWGPVLFGLASLGLLVRGRAPRATA